MNKLRIVIVLAISLLVEFLVISNINFIIPAVTTATLFFITALLVLKISKFRKKIFIPNKSYSTPITNSFILVEWTIATISVLILVLSIFQLYTAVSILAFIGVIYALVNYIAILKLYKDVVNALKNKE